MLVLLNSKANQADILNASSDLSGYIKFVIDIIQSKMTIGGVRDVEGEQLLLAGGSNQSDLWGGGIDWETKEIDFESMINIRPSQNNPSREVLDQHIRQQITNIVTKLLLPE